MERLVIVILVFCSMVMTTGSTPLQLKPSSKEDPIESLLQMTLPLIKQNLINRQEMDSFYRLLANNEDNGERIESKKTTNSVADVGSFESVKRKLADDYGHLRFGRNDKSQDSRQSQDSRNSRIKYNDPDYGHMRFG